MNDLNEVIVFLLRFQFDPVIATQAAAYLMKKYENSLNYMKLIKMLYIANRESIRQSGAPLIPDSYVSMPHGPVLSNLLDQINNPSEDKSNFWDQHIELANRYELTLVKDPGVDELTPRQLQIMDDIDQIWHSGDQYVLRDWTHNPENIPEWEDPCGSSKEIPVREILLRLGWTPAMADEYIQEQLQYQMEERMLDDRSQKRNGAICEIF